MRRLCKFFLLMTMVLSALISVYSQSGTLSGTVTTEIGGEAIPGVSIEIKQTKNIVETDKKGEYKFTGLTDGTYTIIVHSEGFADRAQSVTVTGGSAVLDFRLSLKSINEEVTITASEDEESVFQSFSSVNSIGNTRILEKANTAIGGILENEAGVSKRSFGGPGTTRPSIRGFEGDRVLVLQDGLRNGSVGAASGDHAEPISAFNLERVEVIKGPATLLYGSNAIGGVVNAVTDDEDNAHGGLRGYVTGLTGSVDRQAGIAGGVEYGIKKSLFNINLNSTREGDFNSPIGKVQNSSSRLNAVSGSYGYYSEKFFGRGSATIDRRRYGIPYAALFESGELLSIANGGADCEVVDCQFNILAIRDAFSNELPPSEDETIDIDARRNNYRFSGGFRRVNGPFTRGNIKIDFSDYQHQEIEIEDGSDIVATTFDNDVFSYRGILKQANYSRLSGQIGLEGYNRSYQTVGAEQLIDGRVRQNSFSVFALEELQLSDKAAIQFGGRIENNRYRPVNAALSDLGFTGFSGAVGFKVGVWDGGTFVANFTSSYRPPGLEELYNFGPHIGTVTFEQGNQDLTRERSNGIEFSFRQSSKRVRFNGSFFYNGISNFIFLTPEDADNDGQVDVDDNLPVASYVQGDSRFFGADAFFEADLHDYIGIFATADVVRAELTGNDLSLPRITPARLRTGLDIRYGGFSLRPEALFVGRRGEGDIFSLETATAGYSIFNLNTSYVFSSGRTAHIVTVGLQNLGNRLYRNHVNFLKDLVPETGRGIKISYTFRGL